MAEESIPEHPDEARHGGAAFPYVSHGAWSDHQYAQAGMTLRDWFAGQALAGLMAAYTDVGGPDERIAEWAYRYADAMIARRRQAPTPAGEDG